VGGVKRSTGHTHTHTHREKHPRHRHTHAHDENNTPNEDLVGDAEDKRSLCHLSSERLEDNRHSGLLLGEGSVCSVEDKRSLCQLSSTRLEDNDDYMLTPTGYPSPNTAAGTAHSAHSTQPALPPHRATPRVEDNTPADAHSGLLSSTRRRLQSASCDPWASDPLSSTHTTSLEDTRHSGLLSSSRRRLPEIESSHEEAASCDHWPSDPLSSTHTPSVAASCDHWPSDPVSFTHSPSVASFSVEFLGSTLRDINSVVVGAGSTLPEINSVGGEGRASDSTLTEINFVGGGVGASDSTFTEIISMGEGRASGFTLPEINTVGGEGRASGFTLTEINSVEGGGRASGITLPEINTVGGEGVDDDDCIPPRDTSPHQGSTGTAPSGTPPPVQPPPPPQTRRTQSHSAPTPLKRPMLTPEGEPRPSVSARVNPGITLLEIDTVGGGGGASGITLPEINTVGGGGVTAWACHASRLFSVHGALLVTGVLNHSTAAALHQTISQLTSTPAKHTQKQEGHTNLNPARNAHRHAKHTQTQEENTNLNPTTNIHTHPIPAKHTQTQEGHTTLNPTRNTHKRVNPDSAPEIDSGLEIDSGAAAYQHDTTASTFESHRRRHPEIDSRPEIIDSGPKIDSGPDMYSGASTYQHDTTSSTFESHRRRHLAVPLSAPPVAAALAAFADALFPLVYLVLGNNSPTGALYTYAYIYIYIYIYICVCMCIYFSKDR